MKRPRTLALTALLALLLLGILGAWWRTHRRNLVLVTGQRGGVYHPVGLELERTLRAQGLSFGMEVRTSAGAVENLRLLEEGSAQLGIVTNDSVGASHVRLLAPLFEEHAHLVVHRGASIRSLLDLRGRRVSLGLRGSASAHVATQVLAHFDVHPEQFDARYLSVHDAVEQFRAGTLDAVFALGGLRMGPIDELVHTADATLLTLGDASQPGSVLEAIRLDAPYVSLSTIPQGAYGTEPPTPIGTVSVTALLVARDDVPERQVYELTRGLFTGRAAMGQRQRVLARINEQFDATRSPFSLHAGAEAYYRRNDPPFVSRYANELSLGVTVGALLWSAATALRATQKRRKKTRIEAYFAELHSLREALEGARLPEDFDRLDARVDALSTRALGELATERLDANESYAIFQREREELEHELERRRLRALGNP